MVALIIPQWVGAVCPTCHRAIHHGKNGVQLNAKLEQHLSQLEAMPLEQPMKASNALHNSQLYAVVANHSPLKPTGRALSLDDHEHGGSLLWSGEP